MTTAAPYRIENLDVYRKGVSLGTRLYQSAGKAAANGNSAAAARLRETALAMVLNLAAGLGFWEKEWKTAHFAASKRAVMELQPLLELMTALGEIPAESETRYVAELQDLGKMVSGLLRQSKRLEPNGEGARASEGEGRERAAGTAQ